LAEAVAPAEQPADDERRRAELRLGSQAQRREAKVLLAREDVKRRCPTLLGNGPVLKPDQRELGEGLERQPLPCEGIASSAKARSVDPRRCERSMSLKPPIWTCRLISLSPQL
jgi:hypothetical protein